MNCLKECVVVRGKTTRQTMGALLRFKRETCCDGCHADGWRQY
jgi:hypothetical protein